MDPPRTPERSFHSELVVLVPVFLVPVTWWLALRAHRATRSPQEGELQERVTRARRFTLLAVLDTLIASLLLIAKLDGHAAPLGQPRVELEPTSPFEPLLGFDCGEFWRDELVMTLLPVLVGCACVAAVWLRSKWREPHRAARWGLVLLPLGLAPMTGLAAGHAACVSLGGWSVGVGLLGVLAQGFVMLALGGMAMWLARPELRVVVGPVLGAERTTALGALVMLSGLARVALLVFSLWSLVPELHGINDAGIEVILAGQHGVAGRALVLLAAVGIAPVAEEVLFRGVLLPGLAQSMDARVALFISSIVFALFHVPSHGLAAVLPGVLGYACGWARLRSGGLAAPIALHMANNLLVTLLTWTGGSGT